MDQPTPSQIAKLPAWAREHIATLERQKESAVETFRKFQTQEKETPVFIEAHPCLEGKMELTKHYLDAREVTFIWKGVALSVSLRSDGPQYEDSIQLQWSAQSRGCGHVAMIPTSFQSVLLIGKEKMRA